MERDLQGMNPTERDVDGSNDDEISVHVESSKGSDHDTCSHVELVVPWSAHIHHCCVGVSVSLPMVLLWFLLRPDLSIRHGFMNSQND